MERITVFLRDHIARWARVHAARQGKSLSRMIGELVENLMEQTEAYEATMRRYLARERGPLGGSGRYPKRDDLHRRDAERPAER